MSFFPLKIMQTEEENVLNLLKNNVTMQYIEMVQKKGFMFNVPLIFGVKCYLDMFLTVINCCKNYGYHILRTFIV